MQRCRAAEPQRCRTVELHQDNIVQNRELRDIEYGNLHKCAVILVGYLDN